MARQNKNIFILNRALALNPQTTTVDDPCSNFGYYYNFTSEKGILYVNCFSTKVDKILA